MAQAAQAQGKEINKAWFYFVLSLAILSTQTAILMVPALLVEIATDLEVSVAVAGQLNTATFAAMALSIIAVGPLADSFGRRPVAIAGVFLVLVSVFGSAFAPNMEVFLALRILGGLGGDNPSDIGGGGFRRHIPGEAGPGRQRNYGHRCVDLGAHHSVGGPVRGLVGLAVRLPGGGLSADCVDFSCAGSGIPRTAGSVFGTWCSLPDIGRCFP